MLVWVLAAGDLVSGVLSLHELALPVPAQPAGGPALHLAGEGDQLLGKGGVGGVTNSCPCTPCLAGPQPQGSYQ